MSQPSQTVESPPPLRVRGGDGETGGQPAGNGNDGTSCGPSNNNTTLDPNLFVYAYYTQWSLGQVPASGLAVVFTQDPNACDTGTLRLKANRPTLSGLGTASIHGPVAAAIVFDTTTPASSDQCSLYGGDPNNAHQVQGRVADAFGVGNPNSVEIHYTLSIDGVDANVGRTTDTGLTNIVNAKLCIFPHEPNSLVPCGN